MWAPVLVILVISTGTYAFDKNSTLASIQNCDADIGFLLDSSGSVKQANWTKELNFVSDFTALLTLGENGFDKRRVGVVSFGNDGRLEVKLNDNTDLSSFNQSVQSIRYRDENTNLASGLRVLREDLLDVNNGGRNSVGNIVVIITDGKPTRETNKTLEEARLLKEIENTYVFVIGIGPDIDRTELEQIASTPLHEYRYYAEDFDLIMSYTSIIVGLVCPSVSPPTCQKTKIEFVLDNSGSIGEGNWTEIKEFTKNFLNPLNVVPNGSSEPGVVVGVVTFSTTATVQIPTGAYTDKTDLFRAIDSIAFANQRTNTSGALYQAMNSVLQHENAENEVDPNVEKIMIVVGDGVSNTDVDQLYPNSEAAKAAGFRIFSIGIGRELDMTELDAIATTPPHYHSFILKDFNALSIDHHLNDIRNGVCDISKNNTVITADRSSCIGNYVFVVDVSNGVSQESLIDIRSMLQSLISDLRYGPDDDHVAIVTYGSSVDIIMTLSEQDLDATQLTNKINAINLLSGEADLGRALQEVLEFVMPQRESELINRQTVKDVVVVIAAEPSINEENVEERGEDLRESLEHVEIVVIGVGNDVNVDELVLLASEPTDEHFVRVNSYSDIVDIHGKFANLFCAMTIPNTYECSFESGCENLITQSTSDDFNWTLGVGETPSKHTGPEEAYSGEHYMYAEASSPRVLGDEAVLYLPLPEQVIGLFCLELYAHMHGWHTGALQIFEDRNGEETIRATTYGNHGNEWFRKSTQLNMDRVDKFGIRAIRGGEFSGDIAIDKISYHPGPCGHEVMVETDEEYFVKIAATTASGE